MRASSTRVPVQGLLAPHRGGDGDWGVRFGVPLTLFAVATAGWWWSARMADDMTSGGLGASAMSMGGGAGTMAHSGTTAMADSMSFGAFLLAWTAMMAAMMLPAVLPVVQMYARAATQGRVAPLPFFAAGYLTVWSAMAVPAYLAWRQLDAPLADGRTWVGVLAGLSLLGAALWQLTPLKTACLRHCRSPVGFFLRFGGKAGRPLGAARMGMAHGLFCLGCCWALFAVLVVLGTMNVLWMVVIALFVLAEKTGPGGELIARGGALACLMLGTALLVDPSLITNLT